MADLHSLKGKNVAITGAAGSIATQIAILFAKNGAQSLLLTDVSQSELDKLRLNLESHDLPPSCQLLFSVGDISNEADVEATIAKLDSLGGVDVLVNNAGVFPGTSDGDAISTTAHAWEVTHRVNVIGTWLGSKHAVLSMRRHGKTKGSVINLSSVAGLIGSATAQVAYASSKGAVIAMTRELGIVHAKEGYRFNCLCPGLLDNPMLNDFLDAEDLEVPQPERERAPGEIKLSRRQIRTVHLPQGRFGKTIEVAAAALFLASDMSAFVNATELLVDGGLTKAFVVPDGPPHHSGLENFVTTAN